MNNHNKKEGKTKGLSRDMYEYILKHKHKLKSIDVKNGIVETPRGTNGTVCTSTGYVRAGLGGRLIQVHSLFAILIYGEKAIGKQVNHINGIKTDNRKENLELVTQKENIRHAFNTGLQKSRRGERASRAKLTNKQVVELRKEYNKIKGTRSGAVGKLMNKYNLSSAAFYNIVTNKVYVDV